MLICIQMESIPSQFAFLGTLLCITLEELNSVKMVDIAVQVKQISHLGPGFLFEDMSVLNHQTEDCHSDTIMSLSCCPYLRLFVTCSCDGHLKVWSTFNQLVSDIDFGYALTSVCFANARGDLLVGFLKHICMVQAKDYLPLIYLEQSKECHLIDRIEDPIVFNSDLSSG